MPSPIYADSLRDAADALQAGRVETAYTAYDRALDASASADERFVAEMGMAVCHARGRRWREAATSLADLALRYPRSGMALAYLGAARFELGEIEAARETLDAAVTAAPEEAIAYVKRGEVLARIGLLRPALADFQRAARLPIPDVTTLDYVRAAILSLRHELGSSIERQIPALPGVFGRLARTVRRPRRAPESVAAGALAWRER